MTRSNCSRATPMSGDCAPPFQKSVPPSCRAKASARRDDPLDLLRGATEGGGLPPPFKKTGPASLWGEGLGGARARPPLLSPPMYVALVRVGEASGTLGEILEVLAAERARAEALRR